MIGTRIRARRIEEGMKQEELAAALGVSPAAIGMYEQNRRSPGPKVLKKLCELWDVSADYLLYGNVEPERKASGHPIPVTQFLEQIRDELSRQKGLMFDFTPAGRRHVLTDAELEQLYDAIVIGAEIAMRSRKV